jgi:hypothetical protein
MGDLLKPLRPHRYAATNQEGAGSDGRDQATNPSIGLRQKRATDWDPSSSWRTRKTDERRFLTSLERRYLRDVLLGLEKSDKAFHMGFVVKPQGGRSVADVKLPAPLGKLVVNGLITIENVHHEMRCYLTASGIVAVKNWLLGRPPNFRLMFPRLYQQLRCEGSNTYTDCRNTDIDQ